ncbi:MULTISPECIES: hypothetical protein [Janthinobacterium]|uniref:Uncharacterized protein n=1 Tax=Janthinobacterium lividum TaxID=29581 RepID=A0ABU0XY16_9BURK|nr:MULTISPECIES: hypothetical protein [Janthinobacterium]MBR7636160.1 hypothetical protein [Janthinobacterium lividum]MCC7714743.1 hypothetical protein [Janthinobacterium lividum]MDQ4628033.1 hypothetical protein [Janthinobacterium lividum]MDQ4676851.1 hypothetical protein [Janthinobacterium lividum]MDQ4686677.1 hypothetical protein [Janthinobacterium lividum]
MQTLTVNKQNRMVRRNNTPAQKRSEKINTPKNGAAMHNFDAWKRHKNAYANTFLARCQLLHV